MEYTNKPLDKMKLHKFYNKDDLVSCRTTQESKNFRIVDLCISIKNCKKKYSFLVDKDDNIINIDGQLVLCDEGVLCNVEVATNKRLTGYPQCCDLSIRRERTSIKGTNRKCLFN